MQVQTVDVLDTSWNSRPRCVPLSFRLAKFIVTKILDVGKGYSLNGWHPSRLTN